MRSLTRREVVVEEVGGDDLEVVVGGVREGAPAVAVAQRPDARHVGAELVVHLDEPALVDGDAGLVEAEVVGVRAAADGHQQMRADDLLRAIGGVETGDDVLAALRDLQAFGAQMQSDAFGFQDVGDCSGRVLVLARDQARRHLDHRHLTAEAAVDLREFQADVAAADDDQVRRHEIDLQHRAVGEIGDLVETRNVGHKGTPANIDEDLGCAQGLAADRHRRGRSEARVALVDRDQGIASERALHAAGGESQHVVLARLDLLHVDGHRARDQTRRTRRRAAPGARRRRSPPASWSACSRC